MALMYEGAIMGRIDTLKFQPEVSNLT